MNFFLAAASSPKTNEKEKNQPLPVLSSVLRLVRADRQRHGSPAAGGEGVVGGHRWHRGAGHPGGAAAGAAALLPAAAEGQTEQHTHRLLLHQPHRQLRVRRPRCSAKSSPTGS